MSEPVESADDYLDGMRDCMTGEKHQKGRSVDYDRGYGAQFQHEQNMTELRLRDEHGNRRYQ